MGKKRKNETFLFLWKQSFVYSENKKIKDKNSNLNMPKNAFEWESCFKVLNFINGLGSISSMFYVELLHVQFLKS